MTGAERCEAETVNDECARVRCERPRGHLGLHDDGNGSTWRDPREPVA